MGELEKNGAEKMQYMTDWVASGKKLSEIVRDEKFIAFRKKEDQLIAERNERLLNEKKAVDVD